MPIMSLGRKVLLEKGIVLPRSTSKEAAQYFYNLYRETCIFYHFSSPLKITVGGKTYLTKEHACLFVKGTHDHTFTTETENLHDWIHFKNDITPILNFYGIKLNKIYYPHDTLFIDKILSDMEREAITAPEAPFADLLLNGKIEEFLIVFSRKIFAESNQNHLSGSVLNWLRKIRDYMLENIEKNPSIAEIARAASMSESDFYRRYKQVFGISPKKDMLNVKIERAQDLLVSTDLSVESVAERLGYSTPEQFIKQFKLYCGLTPAKFRKEHATSLKIKSPLF